MDKGGKKPGADVAPGCYFTDLAAASSLRQTLPG